MGAGLAVAPRLWGRWAKLMFLCSSRWHLNYMKTGAPYVTLKIGLRTVQPLQSAVIDILFPIGVIQDMQGMNPGR